MAPVKSRAIVLRRHRLGETSCVVVCYTDDYGKVRLLAKGVRKGGGRFGAALDPFVVSGVVFYLKPGRDLSLVSQADPEREFRELRRDIERQAYAAAALELVDRLVTEHAPDPALFDLVCDTLGDLDGAAEEDLAAHLWSFELELAERLGYAPVLDRCVKCGREIGADASFSIEEGGVFCGRCAGAGYGTGPSVVEALRGLRAGEPLSSLRGLPDRTKDEMTNALLGLLERHSGLELRMRSLSVLQSLERARRTRASAAPNDKEEN